MNPSLYALIGVLVSVAGSSGVAYLAHRANQRRNKVDGELGAGALALRIANRADRQATSTASRLRYLEDWRWLLANEWWPAHLRDYDDVIERDIRRLDPHATIPRRVPMPAYNPPVIDEAEDEKTDG